MADFLVFNFLDVAKSLCLIRVNFESILTNNCWSLCGLGFFLFVFCGILDFLAGKLSLGIFKGVTMPGLLFLLGVRNFDSNFLGAGWG